MDRLAWLALDAIACIVAFGSAATAWVGVEAGSPPVELLYSVALLLFWTCLWPGARLAPVYLENVAHPLPPGVRAWERIERFGGVFLRAWAPGLAALATCYFLARTAPLSYWVVSGLSGLVLGVGVMARLFSSRRHGLPSARRRTRWLPLQRLGLVAAGCLAVSVLLAGAPLLQLCVAATAAGFVFAER
jgi:hypothetical protein